MAARILLVNPPVYDFSAYDFWLRPYGLLAIGGFVRNKGDLLLFDYLDRHDWRAPKGKAFRSDVWGRGKFVSAPAEKPAPLAMIPRRYRRFGLRREEFLKFLCQNRPYDFALIQTVMTYWYRGVREAIGDIRRLSPGTKIILGGPYATLCPEHAQSLGADMVIGSDNFAALWDLLGFAGELDQPALWQGYGNLPTAAIKLSDGCPFRCSYCSVPLTRPVFEARDAGRTLAELELLIGRGAKDIAFYDDALLYKADEVLVPFLEQVLRRKPEINFHTPNALSARFVSRSLAELMLEAGVRTFYLGFESCCGDWQEQTGGKVYANELATAVEHLRSAGATAGSITAYVLLGHPTQSCEQVEESMLFAHRLGIRVMLAEFSPIPGTADGEIASRYVDMNEPLLHNKTAFPIILLGHKKVNYFKDLCRKLNRRLVASGR